MMNVTEEDLLNECSFANNYNDSLTQCLFIKSKEECNDYEGIFNYASMFYCAIGSTSKFPPLLIATILLLILFTSLGTTADDFLCPSLLVISKTLRLSQNIAGVTFLAFGNGAPDIFSSFAGIRQAKPELVVGTIFGAGIFVTCVVTGFIILTGQFKVMERPILRDIFFYGSSVFALWSFCYRGTILLWEAILFLVIYVIYLVTVIVGRIIYNRLKEKEKQQSNQGKDDATLTPTTAKDGFENPGIFVIPDSAAISSDPDDNVFSSAFSSASDANKYYENGVDANWRPRHNSSASSRVTISDDVEQITSFEYVPPRDGSEKQTLNVVVTKERKRSRKVSINEENLRTLNETRPANETQSRPVSRLGIPCNSEPTPRGIIKNPRSSVVSNISNVSNVSKFYANERPRRRTLSHSRYLLHHHLDNAIFTLTHHTNHDESCEDPRCLISPGLLSDDSVSYSGDAYNQVQSSGGKRGRTPRVSTVSVTSNISIKSMKEQELDNLNEWNDLFVHILPFDMTEWSSSTVPVVDIESYRSNWCRLLNCFHLTSAPLMMLILTNNYSIMLFGNVPLIAIIALIGACASIFLYFITNFHEAPKFHSAFAYLGFFASVCWIYFLANEVIDLLQAIGILFGLSDVILGLTVLAWGNSLGDLISNISMAKQGFPRMAISACYGGPLLNLLLGIGLPYTLLLIETPEHFLTLAYSKTITLLFSTLMTGLITILLFLFWNSFVTLKKLGILLFIIYVTYLTIAILFELQVI